MKLFSFFPNCFQIGGQKQIEKSPKRLDWFDHVLKLEKRGLVSKKRGCWYFISINPNITWEIVQANPEKPWDYEGLSINPNITWEIVQANPDKEWFYDVLSYNSNITWEIIQANPDKPWDDRLLCYNPNITWEIVQANPDKPWDYVLLSYNPMGKDENKVVEKRRCISRTRLIKEELLASV